MDFSKPKPLEPLRSAGKSTTSAKTSVDRFALTAMAVKKPCSNQWPLGFSLSKTKQNL